MSRKARLYELMVKRENIELRRKAEVLNELISDQDVLRDLDQKLARMVEENQASSEGGLGQGLGQHTRQKQQSTPGGTKNRDTETGANSKRSGESHNGTVNVIA